jgi:hypothetical protein
MLREIVVASGTKYGKSLSAASALCLAAPRRRQALFRWVSPIYSQSKIGYKYCSRIFPPKPWTKHNKSSLNINIPLLDTNLQFFHGRNAESIEGEAVAGYVLDECAKLSEDIYAAAKTTVTMTSGPMIMCSTPLGKNWFYKKFLEAKEEMERAKFEKRKPEMIAITAPTADNPFVPRENIEFARKKLPNRLFRQFFLAEFLDDGSVFSGIENCLFGHPDEFESIHLDTERWIDVEAKQKTVIIGADWAKSVDYTVFFAIDVLSKKVVGFERFNKVSYGNAVKKLWQFAKSFNSVLHCLHDKTGVGTAIDELVQGLPFAVTGITFTNSLKTQMVSDLIVAIENAWLLLPRWRTMLEELEFYSVETNQLGAMFYSAPDGRHDDTISSLLLAWYGVNQFNFGSEVKTVEDFIGDAPSQDFKDIHTLIYGDDDDD